jgi:hypothetical protein
MKLYSLLLMAILSSMASQFAAFAQTSPMPSCTNNRYLDEEFNVSVQYGINYGNAPAVVYPPYIAETTTYNKSLNFDLYTPTGDTLSKRPAIVMVFGGAFLVGTTLQPQLVDYCQYFAKRGYVVAAIDYRLGFNTLDGETAIRAVYRAAQDVKAAIRYLKLNAATYKIDTNYVFAGGNSAGGIASIHAAYVTETERNASPMLDPTYGGGTFNNWSNLGCTECSGNSYGQAPNYISGVPDLVISLWGAVGDTSFLSTATEAPLISFHGTDDLIVKVDVGSPFDYPAFPTLYGAIPMAARANHIGMTNEIHLFPGAGHEVWVNSSDALYIQQQSANFFYDFLKPATPVISGNSNVCGNSLQTYSVAYHAGARYCWSVSGGAIVGNSGGNSITVQWLSNTTTGSVSVREIKRIETESDVATLNVGIIQLNTPSNLTTVYVAPNRAEIAWTGNAGLAYECEYRLLGTSAWVSTTALSNSGLLLNGLTPCQTYEVRVRAICGGTYYSNYSSIYTFTTQCLRVQLKAILEGFYDANTNAMRTNLRNAYLLPYNQPYNQSPWNYNGTEALTLLPDNMVDWVLLEVRDVNNPSLIIDRTAAILLSDGTIADIDGNANGVKFAQLTQAANYYIALKHRNHIGAMTATPIALPSSNLYDFSDNAAQAYGNQQQTALPNSNRVGLYAADYNHDGIINRSDYNVYKQYTFFAPLYNAIDGSGNGTQDIADFNLYQKNAKVIGISEMR